ncbi:hypothetical protein DRN63_02700 [Nanoarchaeota archaeon]|nr:MAG: hypothetical protein DRN63_02700 [Nanoarchaeota archaeon]
MPAKSPINRPRPGVATPDKRALRCYGHLKDTQLLYEGKLRQHRKRESQLSQRVFKGQDKGDDVKTIWTLVAGLVILPVIIEMATIIPKS